MLALGVSVLLAAAAAAAGEPRPSLEAARRWICFYGSQISRRALSELDLAVLDADRLSLSSAAVSGPRFLAYVSVGEAHEDRAEWARVKDQPYLVEPNPDWPGARRVDLRAPAWRELLLSSAVPRALAGGYHGVFLDTLDVAQHLESKDPERFSGSMAAARDLVLELRRRQPGALILLNNAFFLHGELGAAVDGVVVEDLYTRCRREGPCGPTPPDVSRDKEEALRRFSAATGKPVFVLLYARPKERGARWLKAALRRCRKNGFRPYIATPDLERLGVVDPGGP